MKATLAAAVLALALMTAPMQAGIIIQTGNNPQPDEESILFNGLGSVSQGLTVVGITNSTGVAVNFLGLEELVTPAAGQARIEALDGSLLGYTVSVPGSSFLDYIFALNVGGTTTGTATIKVNVIGGSSLTGSFTVGNGENFFTAIANGGDRIESVQVTSDVALTDVRDNRISGIETVPQTTIPEPGSWALLGGGLAVIGASIRRRLQSR
jgi:hypothetical protein